MGFVSWGYLFKRRFTSRLLSNWYWRRATN